MVICWKTDLSNRNASSAWIDARNHFKSLLCVFGRFHEAGYLRATNDLNKHQSKREQYHSISIHSDEFSHDMFVEGSRKQESGPTQCKFPRSATGFQ